jgi:Tetratricopeptide repeat
VEELQIMCVVGVKERLGSDHVDTAMAVYNLAVNYYVTRRFGQARDLARETERIQREGLGRDHPHYLLTVKLLGDIEDGMLQVV